MYRSNNGSFVNGFNVGILTLRTRHPLLPGNVQHAASFGFPVCYEPVELEDPRALLRGEPQITDSIIEAARKLVERNVAVIAGACGSFAYYQRAVADAVPVPVFLSIMMQVPLLLNGLGARRRLCVICSDTRAMNERVFEQCGITDTSRIVFKALMGVDEFRQLLNGESDVDMQAFESKVVTIAREAVGEDPAIDAILLQCSDLPPFGHAVQQATGKMVFDMTLMIRWLESAAYYPLYGGGTRPFAPASVLRK